MRPTAGGCHARHSHSGGLRLRVRLAAACGADEQGVAATTAATSVAAVAVPALFVYVCLPLLHAGQEVMEWEEDHLPWSCCWCARALPVAVPDAKKTHAISGSVILSYWRAEM